MWELLIKKGKEVTTWVGLGSLFALVGINVAPELQNAIGQFLVAFFSLLAIIFNESKPKE